MKAMIWGSYRGDIPRSASIFAAFEGTFLIALGLVALCFPASAGIATSMVFGWILIAGGVAGLAGAFVATGYAHFWWSLFSSLLAIGVGGAIAFHPFAGAMALILLISTWLLLDGVSSLMIALDLRRGARPSWGWLIVSALVDWLFAALMLVLSPVAALLAIGVIVGIDLIVGGLALVALGWGLRPSAKARGQEPRGPAPA